MNSAARSLRAFLGNFATFRYLRRSQLALAIGAHLRIGGQSLWPNMDVVLEKQISDKHKYQWDLNNAILERINEETEKLGGKLVIVGIPYLPQVYDEIWDGTFGGDQTYSRTAATERLAAWCEDHDITYVETLDALREQVKSPGPLVAPSRRRPPQRRRPRGNRRDHLYRPSDKANRTLTLV